MATRLFRLELTRHVLKEIRTDEAERDDGHWERVVGERLALPGLKVRPVRDKEHKRIIDRAQSGAGAAGVGHNDESRPARSMRTTFSHSLPLSLFLSLYPAKYLRFVEVVEGDADPDGAEHEQEEE